MLWLTVFRSRLEQKGNNMEEILYFYLTNHSFQVFVNKGCQTYNKTRDEMLNLATVKEVYREMQHGGCNEERDGGENSTGTNATDSTVTCDT
ncbi:MAG: hypothetical protein IIY21_16315 [Clostridiales bacterium]|nr:hypothetical protein [Clostridiales bacterium]MBQ1570128.1 hypothetical protein [Clostridiales bacterium]